MHKHKTRIFGTKTTKWLTGEQGKYVVSKVVANGNADEYENSHEKKRCKLTI